MRPTGTRLQVIEAMVVLSLFVMSVGCNGFFVDPTLTSISISPASPSVSTGKTVQLSAFGTYDDGSRKTITGGVNWSSGSPNVASIDQKTGIATGLVSGTSSISADSQGVTTSATLTVVPATVTSITISPSNPSITRGSTQQFTATAQDGTDITNVVSWSSSDTSQVTISSTGLATSVGNTAVQVTITATITTSGGGTVSKAVTLTVS